MPIWLVMILPRLKAWAEAALGLLMKFWKPILCGIFLGWVLWTFCALLAARAELDASSSAEAAAKAQARLWAGISDKQSKAARRQGEISDEFERRLLIELAKEPEIVTIIESAEIPLPEELPEDPAEAIVEVGEELQRVLLEGGG